MSLLLLFPDLGVVTTAGAVRMSYFIWQNSRIEVFENNVLVLTMADDDK